MSPARGPLGTRASCAAILITCALVVAACSNDFDALFDGPKVAPTDGGKTPTTPAGDDDDAPDPDPTCAAKTCEAKLEKGDKGSEVHVADQCCAYATTCTNPLAGVCATTCSNGAVCKSTCEIENVCQFDVTNGASSDVACRAGLCNVTCSAGATCRVDCQDSDDCHVTCDAASTCLVRSCSGTRCSIECPGGKPPQTCGDGTKSCGGCK